MDIKYYIRARQKGLKAYSQAIHDNRVGFINLAPSCSLEEVAHHISGDIAEGRVRHLI